MTRRLASMAFLASRASPPAPMGPPPFGWSRGQCGGHLSSRQRQRPPDPRPDWVHSVDGLDGALGVVVGPSGDRVYATGAHNDSLLVPLNRNHQQRLNPDNWCRYKLRRSAASMAPGR